jgi:predicted PurR-regulated permease PerM
VIFAALFSMLLLPLSEKLENLGLNKVLAVLVSVITLIAAIALIISLLSWQLSETLQDLSKVEQNVSSKLDEIRRSISTKLGISQATQKEVIKDQQTKGAGLITSAVTSVGSFATDFILIIVYIFLFLYYREHLKNFVLKLTRQDQQGNAREIIDNCRKVAQKYLSGLAIMIASLWVLYSIGFSIVGVENAIFFAILCGLLEIVPFVGNLTGSILTALMVIAQGGSSEMVLGVFITYGLVQFFQTYVLEPLVVGKNVNINPLVTIAGIVFGEFIWGIPGMILAIPLLAMTKIICDHIEPLKPYGYLIGTEKEESSFRKRISKLLRKK